MTLEGLQGHKPTLRTPKEWLRTMFCGMCMGAADLVPGFSGGTVAFIMGIYPSLIRSILSFNPTNLRYLLTLQLPAFFNGIAWEFLLALVSGIFLSLITWVHVIHHMLGDPQLRMYLMSAFFGLVIASIGICARQVREWNAAQIFWAFAGAGLAFLSVIGAMQHDIEKDTYDVAFPSTRIPKLSNDIVVNNYDHKTQRLLAVPEAAVSAMLVQGIISESTPAYSNVQNQEGVVQDFVQKQSKSYISPYIIFCGAIAICALLLPGISGSYLLVIMGLYSVIIGALADLVFSWTHLSFDVDAFMILANLAVGIGLGLSIFARIVGWLMRNYHDQTVATMTGFVIGAMPAIWPFWSYTYQLMPLRLQDGPQLQLMEPLMPDVVASYFWISVVVAALAFALAFLLEYVSKKDHLKA
ncbi:MAG: DUF368 domain-containing protein [Chlamydiales bacterium]|nr:DUF368 domain-containing protein [Chlamydiales bacterium]